MTEVGKTQGYTGCELKKEVSEIGEDGDDNGEEKEEDMGGEFFEIKQENSHEAGGYHADNVVWCRRSRRWSRGRNKRRDWRNREEESKPGASRGVLTKRLLVLGRQLWMGQPSSLQKQG